MASQRSVNRIVMNVALDGALASVAAVLARWIADPGGGLLHPLWFLAGGAITLLVGGLPFRMAQQYWRFAGVEDLLGVAGGSIVSAALFAALLLGTGFPLPTVTFPIVHALTLMLLLGAPRVVYRVLKARSARSTPAVQRVLLVGAGEGCWRWAASIPGSVCKATRSWAACRRCGGCWTASPGAAPCRTR
jgi:O-antigen biosynthesis protein WbqV